MPGPPDFVVEEENGVYYVAREVLVNREDLDLVAGELRGRYGAREVDVPPAIRDYVALFQLGPQAPDVPTVVRSLRVLPVSREPRVGPNHVVATGTDVVAQPAYHAGPGGPPTPAAPPNPPPAPKLSTADAVRVAVLDTGVDPAALNRWPLVGRFDLGTFAADPVYVSNGAGAPQIALMGGHGTMVAGILAWHAPNAVLMSYKVLDGNGVGTESDVLAAVPAAVAAGATVLNLSLGCFSLDNKAPVLMESMIKGLANRVSVVAAAGNSSSTQPFWPAAFERVVAVAALDTTFPQQELAGFSNRGPWVDGSSAGVRTFSSYVTGTWSYGGASAQFTGYAGWSGTSFATPHVAAMIADGVQGGLTARQVEQALILPRPPGDKGAVLIPSGVLIN